MNKNYEKIYTYIIDNIYILIPLTISALLFDGLMCFIPMLEGKVIDSLNSGDTFIIINLCIAFISLVLFVQINRFFKRYLVRVFGNRISLKMREISFSNLLNKDLNFFVSNNTGDVLNGNFTDIADTTEGIRKITTEIFDTFVLLIGYFIMMLYTNYFLALIVLPFFILSILASHFMKKIVYKTNKDYKEYLSINKELTLSSLNNELYYRSFGCFDSYFNKYEKSIKELKKKATKALLYQSSLEPIYLAIALSGLGCIAVFGGLNVINNNGLFTIGMLSSFFSIYILVSKKAGKVGKLFNAYQGFKVSWGRCKSYLVNDNYNIESFVPENNTLILKDFTLGYNYFSLPKITAKLYSGQIIGVCGKVHTGKTTLLNGLTGLYDYNGKALLGKIDIYKYKYETNQYISYCSSNISIFSESIKNNICLGRQGDLISSLETSQLYNDLERLGGEDYLLSHTNHNLSGGEQKRLQMARTLYSSSKLILLDDPFQSVNSSLAINMINQLKNYKDSIIILVSNNKDILINTDKIIFINDDELEVSSYKELLSNVDFKELMGVL